MKELENVLSSWFAKLPNLPTSVHEVLVKLAPYFAIVGLILSLPVILLALGLGAIAAPILAIGGMWTTVSGGALALIYSAASVILLGLSISGLLARHAEGWRYLYYNTLLGGAYAIVRMDLGSLIIGTGISLYLLFQIRSYYK